MKKYFNTAISWIKKHTGTIFSALIFPALISLGTTLYLDSLSSKREFLYEFSRTFFDNPEYRRVSIALEEQYLYNKGRIFSRNGGEFSDYEIDNYIYLLYDLYSLVDEKLISSNLVAEQYAYYVCITYNNKEIQNYRLRLLKEGFSDNQALGYLSDLAKLLDISKTTNCKTIQ